MNGLTPKQLEHEKLQIVEMCFKLKFKRVVRGVMMRLHFTMTCCDLKNAMTKSMNNHASSTAKNTMNHSLSE